MQANKTQYGRALAIIPSDTVPIPNIATEVVRGTTTGSDTNLLIDNETDFSLLNVNQMAIVYNLSANSCTTAIRLDGNFSLLLTDDIMGTGEDYVIYNEADIAGCAILVQTKTAPELIVKTIGGDVVTLFLNGESTTLLPINVSMVYAASADINNVVGLW
jgi:hypothetical protein